MDDFVHEVRSISVSASPEITPIESSAITLTLESIGIILAALVSISMLGTGIVQIISKFNRLGEKIRDLQEDNKNNNEIIKDAKRINFELLKLDKKLDLHLQAMESRNKLVELALSQLDKRIDTNMAKEEKETKELKTELRQLEKFLQQQTTFKVRERE